MIMRSGLVKKNHTLLIPVCIVDDFRIADRRLYYLKQDEDADVTVQSVFHTVSREFLQHIARASAVSANES